MARRSRLSLFLAAAVLVGVLVPAFLMGIARSDRLCETNTAGAPAAAAEGVSMWPPGVECSYERPDGTRASEIVPWTGFGRALLETE